MAKLYAELTSDKGGRVVGKGGESFVIAEMKSGNKTIFSLAFDGNQCQLNWYDKNKVITMSKTYWKDDTHQLNS